MRLALIAFALSLGTGPATAADVALAEALNESVIKLPVNITLPNGNQAQGQMLLTTYKPAGPGPFPIAIINHGRSTDRSGPDRFRMLGMASYLVRYGFAVFVPTRLGYGGSVLPKSLQADGSADPEASGDCRHKDYAIALQPALEEIAATLSYARQQRYIDASRHLVVGHSSGGFATVAYAAGDPPGLMGYANFAGGVGGDPLRHPGIPCQAERLAQAFAAYGRTTHAPSLWIYSENDQYFAPRYSRAWYRAFTAGGSPSQFILQAPFDEDGHRLLSDGLLVWRPMMDAFFVRLGMQTLPPPEEPAASGYATIRDAARIPWLNAKTKASAYAKFLAAPAPRAFAISEAGSWGWANGPEDATGMALVNCNRHSPKPCVLYAVDDAVIWRAPTPQDVPTTQPSLTKQP